MSLRDCPVNRRHGPTVRVPERPTSQAQSDEAEIVTDEFTARCSKCGDMKKWDAESLRRQFREAKKMKQEIQAGELRDALEGWGFPPSE